MSNSRKSSQGKPIALDGGWAWIALLGSFVAYFIADGWAYSFGVLYTDLLQQFSDGKGKTALIGALLYGVPLLVSPFVCALTNIYGCRIVTITGGFIIGVSFIVSYFVNSVNLLCVTTGVIASIGLAMTYVPAIVIVTYYFEKRRGFATGLAVTGSALGAFAFPPLMELLIEKYMWKGTLLIFGAIAFNIIVAGALFRPPPMTYDDEEELIKRDFKSEIGLQEMHFRQGQIVRPCLHSNQLGLKRSKSSDDVMENKTPLTKTSLRLSHVTFSTAEDKQLVEESVRICNRYANVAISCPDIYADQNTVQESNTDTEVVSGDRLCQKLVDEIKLIISSMLDKRLATDLCYLLWCASTFILYMWVGTPYVYLVDKVVDLGIAIDDAVFLLSIVGIGRAIGQVFFGFLADFSWVNNTLTYATAIGICGFSTLLVPHLVTYPLLALYCAAFGMFVSVTYNLQVMCIVDIVGIDRTTNAFGLFQLVQGIGTLLGTPVAGWLFDKTGSYDISFYCAGAWILFSAIILTPLYFMLKRRNARNNTT